MIPNTNQNITAPYLRTTRPFSEEGENLKYELSKMYTEVAQSVNRRSIGAFYTNQVTTGNTYYYTTANDQQSPPQYRQSYRKVFPFTTIAAGATLTIAHGITNITQIVALYGNAITAGTTDLYIPIPLVSVTAVTAQVSVTMDNTNIYIKNGATADNILSGTIVVEALLT